MVVGLESSQGPGASVALEPPVLARPYRALGASSCNSSMCSGKRVCPVVGPSASFQRRHPDLLRSLGGFCFVEDPCPSALAVGLYSSGLCPQLHPHCPNPEQVLGKCLMKLAKRLCSADPWWPGP